MNKAKDIKSGSVFEIPLAKNYGFAYVKLIFSRDITTEVSDCLIVKAYDKFSKKPLDNFDKNFFETDNILFFPWLSLGYPPLRGPKKWRHLGYADLTNEDKVFPDFLDYSPSLSSSKSLQESYSEKWGFSFRRNFQNKRLFSHKIENIQHLGSSDLRAPEAIVQILTMHFMRVAGFDLPEIYSKEELEKDFWIKLNWKELTSIPVDIRTKEKIHRLRAIDEA